MTEFAQVYGGPASTLIGAAIAACMVVWQVEIGNEDVRADISRSCRTFPRWTEMDVVESKLDITSNNILAVT